MLVAIESWYSCREILTRAAALRCVTPVARAAGEAREEGMISTLVEQVVHCKIIRVIRPMPKEGHENERTLPYKVLCKLENGLTGVLQEMHFADSEEDKIRFQSSIREDMTSELSARARCPLLYVSGFVTLLPSAWLPATVLSCCLTNGGWMTAAALQLAAW